MQLRQKKKSECSEEVLTDTQNFQSSLPVCLGANVSCDKECLFQQHFEEGHDLYDEEYSRWLESNHPDTLPNQVSSKQNDFPCASSLVHSDNDSLLNDYSSITTPISSPQSLPESCRNSHSSNEKEYVNNNLATAQPNPCASLFYSFQAAQFTVVNSGSVSSPIKRSPLTSLVIFQVIHQSLQLGLSHH